MILYIAVARCPTCGRPAFGYRRQEPVSKERKAGLGFTLRCLEECGWTGVLDVAKNEQTMTILEMPWEEPPGSADHT